MRVARNTYPLFPNCPHAEPGDVVRWEFGRGVYNLIRVTDGKAVFASAPVDRNGNLRSNGRPPVLVGVVAQVKSKGWILEVTQE